MSRSPSCSPCTSWSCPAGSPCPPCTPGTPGRPCWRQAAGCSRSWAPCRPRREGSSQCISHNTGRHARCKPCTNQNWRRSRATPRRDYCPCTPRSPRCIESTHEDSPDRSHSWNPFEGSRMAKGSRYTPGWWWASTAGRNTALPDRWCTACRPCPWWPRSPLKRTCRPSSSNTMNTQRWNRTCRAGTHTRLSRRCNSGISLSSTLGTISDSSYLIWMCRPPSGQCPLGTPCRSRTSCQTACRTPDP